MVAIRDWMVLLLVGAMCSKAPESSVVGMTVAKRTQDAIVHNGLKRAYEGSMERIDGGSSVSRMQTSLFGSPRKKLRMNDKEAMKYYNQQSVDLENMEQRSSEERKAEIAHNLARHQEELTSLKVEGEPMRRMFDLLMRNEDMLKQYGQVADGTSISSVVKKLKEIQRDINEAIQIRFRTWAGLGGRILEPAFEEKIESLSRQSTHKPTDDLQIHAKAHMKQQLGSGSRTQVCKIRQIDGKSEETTRLTRQASQGRISDPKQKILDVGAKEALLPQLNENYLWIINEKVVSSRVEVLKLILQGVKFPNYEDPGWEVQMEKIRAIKLCFQKPIFQAIGFMRKFKLIDEEYFRAFFSTECTLEVIGEHLVDLFPVAKYGLFHPLCFNPDFEFLSNYWQTKHLHEILKALTKAQQAHVIGTSLVYIFKLSALSTELNGVQPTSFWSSRINGKFFQKHFLTVLEGLQPKEYPGLDSTTTTQNSYVRLCVAMMIKGFQEPIDSRAYQGNYHCLMQVEYLLNYHFLSFIKTYYKQHLREFFRDGILEDQLELVKQGLKVHQLIKQVQIYTSIISFSGRQFHPITKCFAREERKKIMKEYSTISKSYKNLLIDFRNASKDSPKAKNWLQGTTFSKDMLVSFYLKSISLTKGLKLEGKRKKEILRIHKIKKKNFDLDSIEDQEILNIMDPGEYFI